MAVSSFNGPQLSDAVSGPRLAGVDWMMMEIGRQRNYEILMQTAQALPNEEHLTTNFERNISRYTCMILHAISPGM